MLCTNFQAGILHTAKLFRFALVLFWALTLGKESNALCRPFLDAITSLVSAPVSWWVCTTASVGLFFCLKIFGFGGISGPKYFTRLSHLAISLNL